MKLLIDIKHELNQVLKDAALQSLTITHKKNVGSVSWYDLEVSVVTDRGTRAEFSISLSASAVERVNGSAERHWSQVNDAVAMITLGLQQRVDLGLEV